MTDASDAERKVDFWVTELKNYNISIPGILKTKCFGSEWTFVHLVMIFHTATR